MSPGGRRLVGQEGDVHSVHSELLLAELEAGLFLIQLCQGLLQLLSPRRELVGASKELSPQQLPIIPQEGQVQVPEEFCMLILHSKLFW